MALDDRDLADARHDDPAPYRVECPAARSAAPAGLVLFVGTPPAAALCELLALDGMRSLWLAGPAQALRAAALAHFDALVIDAAALGGRAAAWLVDLRAQLRCPLLVVAEQADEIDEIVALEVGADAYLTRPLAARRLRAHLAALLRLRLAPRSGDEAPAGTTAIPPAGGWRLDRVANRLEIDGRRIALTEVQGALLQCLAEARGRIVPRARLAAALPHGQRLEARSVDVYIHRLRRRLCDEGIGGLTIEAVRGRGYALAAGDNAAP